MTKHCFFITDDLKYPGDLADKLWKTADPLSVYLLSRLSSRTKELLEEYGESGSLSEVLNRALVDEFNRMVKDPDLIRNIQQYAKIEWSGAAPEKLEQKADWEELYRFNRLVLESAYPRAFLGMSSVSGRRVHVDKIIFTPSFRLGPRLSYGLINDPKHLLFVLARYKFCAKMLQGKSSVLELGCGDGFGSPIVAQVVENLLCVDREPVLIDGIVERFADFKRKFNAFRNIEFQVMDMIHNVPDRKFDGAFSIDTIEHFDPEKEDEIIGNLCRCLSKDGILIIGTPNVEAEKYSSEPGASPHINLKSHSSLKELLERYFVNSFIFSMNDEIVHTGFYPMSHYLFGIGTGKR